MSIWADIHKRSNGTAVKKEDVNAKIAEALEEIDMMDYAVKSLNDIYQLKVLSRDKHGTIFMDYVWCHVSYLFNIAKINPFIKTLNSEENINRIKSKIGDRTFVSLKKI